jgi:hypothetical protein
MKTTKTLMMNMATESQKNKGPRLTDEHTGPLGVDITPGGDPLWTKVVKLRPERTAKGSDIRQIWEFLVLPREARLSKW